MDKERKERLKKVYNSLLINGLIESQKDLAKATGANPASVSQALKGEEKYLTDSFLVRIYEAYPNILCKDWLLTGEGEMLKPESSARPGYASEIPDGPPAGATEEQLHRYIRELKVKIADMEIRLTDKDALISSQRETIASKNETIAALKRHLPGISTTVTVDGQETEQQ